MTWRSVSHGHTVSLLLTNVAFLLLLAGCGGGGGSAPVQQQTSGAQPPAISISISPTTAITQIGANQQFTTFVSNSANAAVTWQVNGEPGGNPTIGTISASGLYVAPSSVPTPPTVTVTAVLQSDTTKTASASLTISPVLTIITGTLPSGLIGGAYTAGLASRGGTPPTTWALVSGALPPGLSLNAGNGAISGTLTDAGVFYFTVRVSDTGTPTHTDETELGITVSSVPKVWAWGCNNYGQLGDRTTINRMSPVQVSGVTGLSGVVAIAGGYEHSMALESDATVWAWGNNSYGQLGIGESVPDFVRLPWQLTMISGVPDIQGGGFFSLALKNDGTVWDWGEFSGWDFYPSQVSSLSGVVAIAAGGSHKLALRSDGTVWAWGYNSSGQLGDGTTTYRSTPVQVSNLSGVVAIAGGGYHSFAQKNDGTVWAWGLNSHGELGDGTTTNRSTPVQVSSISGVVAIVGGYGFSLGLKDDGTVWGWGSNLYGQLGDGTTTDRTTPIQVSSLSGVVAIGAGGGHSLALKSDGTVWSWGYNAYGQLGDGTLRNSIVPVQVSGLSEVTAIAGGNCHSLALK